MTTYKVGSVRRSGIFQCDSISTTIWLSRANMASFACPLLPCHPDEPRVRLSSGSWSADTNAVLHGQGSLRLSLACPTYSRFDRITVLTHTPVTLQLAQAKERKRKATDRNRARGASLSFSLSLPQYHRCPSPLFLRAEGQY